MPLALLLGVLAGCAAQPKVEPLVWPPPPLTTRIKFVGIYRGQEDLGKDHAEMVVELLAGKKKRQDLLQQPMGVAVSRDAQRVHVADYAQDAVFVFDFGTRRVSVLRGEKARLKRPLGIALDAQDNLYVVNTGNSTIQVLSPAGEPLRAIADERLSRPAGVAIDPARGRLYVSDAGTREAPLHVIHVLGLQGDYRGTIGRVGAGPGEFSYPTLLAVDPRGRLYVADTLNSRVQVFDPDGRLLQTIGQAGTGLGMFSKPKGVALDSFGNIYVSDSAWSSVQIFNERGEILLFFGGTGRYPGLMINPTGIAIDRNNRIYVTDAFYGLMDVYDLVNTTAADSFATGPVDGKEEKRTP